MTLTPFQRAIAAFHVQDEKATAPLEDGQIKHTYSFLSDDNLLWLKTVARYNATDETWRTYADRPPLEATGGPPQVIKRARRVQLKVRP